MPTVVREVLEIPAGFRSSEAASFFAQLNDQSSRMAQDTRHLTPHAIAWQPAPGMNTIGMLLAHIAIVEVFWTQVGPLGMTQFESESILGIGVDDDGMPLAEGGSPPAGLRGKDIAYFDDLLRRARAYSQKALAALTDADLERELTRTRRDASVHVTTMRWILYHMVEHLAGHYGQINLLSHQHRIANPPA